MKLLIPILLMLGVAVGSFAVFALLVSYLRYRKMQLISLDQVNRRMSPSAAVMVILKALLEDKKPGERCLLRFEPGEAPDTAAPMRDFLRTHLRQQDEAFLLDDDQVLALLKCPEEHLAATARRLIPLLQGAGFKDGALQLSNAEADPDKLLSNLEQRTEIAAGQGWRITPGRWRENVFPVAPDVPADNREFERSAVQSVSVDPLTGVLKADRVARAVRRLFASHRRTGRPVTLVKVDVDELDSYNTTYGRETGDRILQRTATILMNNCRETDLIGRMEEDAFILVMEGKDEDLLQAVRRMSDRIKNSTLVEGDSEIRFSVAFGLASMPADGKNPVVLLEKAEWALQEAKQRGRGMCVAFQPSHKPKSISTLSGEDRPEHF